MESGSRRITVTLDVEHAAKLAQLAERTHEHERALASALLSIAVEDADPDARNVVSLLDRIDGAYERATSALARARADETIPMAEL